MNKTNDKGKGGMMKKKLSDMSPSELKKTRINTAIIFALLYTILRIIFLPAKTIAEIVGVIIGSIVGGIMWYFLWHRVAIWFEKKFTKR